MAEVPLAPVAYVFAGVVADEEGAACGEGGEVAGE